MDPVLYEETKRILVNIRRNRILKTAARWVISKNDAEDVMDASPAAVTVKPRAGPVPAAPPPPPAPTRQDERAKTPGKTRTQ